MDVLLPEAIIRLISIMLQGMLIKVTQVCMHAWDTTLPYNNYAFIQAEAWLNQYDIPALIILDLWNYMDSLKITSSVLYV